LVRLLKPCNCNFSIDLTITPVVGCNYYLAARVFDRSAEPMPRVHETEKPLHRSLDFDDFIVMCDLGRFPKHNRCGTIFLGGKLNGSINRRIAQPFTFDDEMHMDPSKHFRIGFRPLGLELQFTIPHVMPPFPEDVDDVERRAATHSHQQHFHRTHAEIPAARFRRSIHDDRVATAGLGQKQRIFNPFDARFH